MQQAVAKESRTFESTPRSNHLILGDLSAGTEKWHQNASFLAYVYQDLNSLWNL